MADLIDRYALLKDMGLTDAVKYGNKDAEQQYRSYSTWMSYEIADSIWDAPAVNRWISCEDELPENEEKVWVCLYWGKDAYVRKGYVKNEVWYTADGYRMCIIPKFWMHEYIPEPPEKE